MGRNRQVPCPTCSKSVRSDNLQRHLRSHAPKRRKVYVNEEAFKFKKQMNDLMRKHSGIIWHNDVPTPRDLSCVKIEYFGDVPYVVGNLSMKSILSKLVRAHYSKFLTLEFCQSLDGILTSDEEWWQFFIDRQDKFNENTSWHHVITEDTLLWGRIYNMDHVGFTVLESACNCICSELAKNPLSEEEVKYHMETGYAAHSHIIIETSRHAPIGDLMKVISSYSSESTHLAKGSRGTFTNYDKMRLYHYVNRRESSTGLTCHWNFSGTEAYQFFSYKPSSWDPVFKKVKRVQFEPMENKCMYCIKMTRPCSMHMTE